MINKINILNNMEDIESNLNQEDHEVGTSDLFELDQWDIPSFQNKINSIAVSEQFLYIITREGEVIRWKIGNSESLNQSYSLPQTKTPPSNSPEKLTKIFCDRKGNHAIIKHGGKMFYFNGTSNSIKELPSLKGIEVYAVGFDEKNTNPKSTGEILLSDYENKIYSYYIELEQGKIKDGIAELIQLDKRDRIYGLEVSLILLIFFF